MSVMDCIERIPSKLKEINELKESRFSALLTYLGEKNKLEEIVFVASGTSYNSAFTTKRFLEKECQLKVSLVYPNMFVNYGVSLNKNALYILISQGGSTKLVYDALQLIKRGGCMNASITEETNSPIAREADVAIEMGSGHEEYLYRTLGYSTTVATIYMLGMTLAKHYKTLGVESVLEMVADYEQLYDSLPVIKEATMEWYSKNKFSLMRRNKLMIAGTNDLWPVAQEADIKLMEMVPMMSRSFELEEFIHGPQNAFDDSTLFFILSREQEDDDKVKAIAKFIKNEIGFCSVIGANANDAKDLPLVIQSKYFSTLEYITVMQVLAYQLAIDHGRDLSRGINAQVKDYIKKSL